MTQAAPASPPGLAPPACARCGAGVVGAYCSACGAPATKHRDLSVQHYTHELVSTFADVDSALLASVRALFFKPGELTREYLHGSRFRYLPPIRVFLFCNIIYFFVASQFRIHILTVPFDTQTYGMSYSAITQAAAARTLHVPVVPRTVADSARQAAAFREFASRYDAAGDNVAKLIVIALVPMYALLLFVLYAGSGRYFAEHLIFATHFVAFMLVGIPVVGFALAGWFTLIASIARGLPDIVDAVFPLVFVGTLTWYAFAAQRTVYGASRVKTAARTTLSMAALAPILIAFKFVLFYATLYWIT